MPLNGLPYTLETMLDKLLEENVLTSWNIQGKEFYTQVSLRFSMHDSTHMDNTFMKYKRATPSQIKRDKIRSIERQT